VFIISWDLLCFLVLENPGWISSSIIDILTMNRYRTFVQ
jgi:hypothetical protein